MKVLTVAEMVAAEQSADSHNHSYATMMELAGRQVAKAIETRYEIADKRILILVGSGNNGGDGLVAGRYLAQAGADVAFYLFKPRDPAQDANFAQVRELGLFVIEHQYDIRQRVLRTRLNSSDLVIDGLLGTGVSRPITGELATVLRVVRGALRQAQDETYSVPVIAVDCPSGLNCDTGVIDPLALSADLTVTFANPKRGHYLFPGAAQCGELVVADIGIKPEWLPDADVDVATDALIASWLPERPLDGHKGTFGRVLVAGGSADYWGAPILSGMGAYRAGCGLVALAIPNSLRSVAATHLPEATMPRMVDAEYLGADSAEKLLPSLPNYHSVLLGPGLGTKSDEFLGSILAQSDLPPLIIDADGLNYLARQSDWWESLPSNTILTPHTGEMQRLVSKSVNDVDRITLAIDYAKRWRVILVLKGAYTIIATPNGYVTIIPIATPALAVAGSGDVLAGCIASFVAQGLPAATAAIVGAYLHAQAGQQLAQNNGNAGILAREIADAIPTIRQLLSTAQSSLLR